MMRALCCAYKETYLQALHFTIINLPQVVFFLFIVSMIKHFIFNKTKTQTYSKSNFTVVIIIMNQIVYFLLQNDQFTSVKQILIFNDGNAKVLKELFLHFLEIT